MMLRCMKKNINSKYVSVLLKMHSYLHNIKTFNSATMHLTHVERSLYRCLIELYYDTEQPLPATDIDRLARRVMAHSEEEKAALSTVLDEFFEKTGDVYTHEYCDMMIENYHANKSSKSRAGKASAEARRKRAAEKKQQRIGDAKQKSTCVEQVLNSVETEAQQNPTNHKPLTINHKPLNINTSSLFAMFWESGIRKVGKKDAEKIFSRIIKKQKDPDRFTEQIIQDVKARISSNQFGFDRMHPSTYLNGERWLDEITREAHASTNGSLFDISQQKYASGDL